MNTSQAETAAKSLTRVTAREGGLQAARVSDYTAFLLGNAQGAGELVEYGPTRSIFTNPRDERTESYIIGRFG